MSEQKQKGISFGYCDVNTGARVYPPLLDSTTERLQSSRQDYQSPGSDMYANITCVPPIGQATIIPKSQATVTFSVLLETTQSSVNDEEVKVVIWHDQGRQDWIELPLSATEELDHVLVLNSPEGLRHRWYTGELPRSSDSTHPVSFTVKFQIGSGSAWKWVRDQTSTGDGTIHYQQPYRDVDFPALFQDTSSELSVIKESADTAHTTLYHLTASVEPAKGQVSGYSEHILGVPRDYMKWFSLVRLWSPWLAPRQGRGQFNPDKDAVLAAFLRNDGTHVVCLAISGVDDVLTIFTHDANGNVVIRGRNDREKTGVARVVVAASTSFEVANAAVMYYARKVVAGYELQTDEHRAEIEALIDKNVKAEWLEEWYDGFTYCTWNGLGQSLSESKIDTALESLKKEGINISNLIIDDNWQSLSSGSSQFQKGMTEFDANKEGFPRGLKATVSDIRKNHPNINHIAVWHAILGYWGGIAKDSKIAKEYKTITVEKEKGVAEGSMLVVDEPDVQRFYNDFYAFLSDAGIDAVKTDAQFFLDMMVHAPDRRRLLNEYQDSWTIAHLRHFSSRAISCMSQTPQILFHSQLPTNKPRLLVRNSDDFFPEIAASHPWHIFCNAHNSLLTQHLNVIPDWDMFQTNHPWAGFHGAARCVSGGPIYFTDEPGKHDIKLINQMTAKTPRGKTVILRPQNIGKSMNAYSTYEEEVVLKVGTYVGYARTGTGILGLFNCVQRPLFDLVRLEDFPGTEEGEYIIRSFGGAVSEKMSRGGNGAFVGVKVGVHGWDILSAHPVRQFRAKSGNIGVAFLGLLGKMTGIAALSGSDVYVEEGGRLRIWLSVKALGVFGLWVSGLSRRSIEDGMLILMYGKPIPRSCVKRSSTSKEVLEIDMERAWKETDQDAGWSNEVSIEVFIS